MIGNGSDKQYSYLPNDSMLYAVKLKNTIHIDNANSSHKKSKENISNNRSYHQPNSLSTDNKQITGGNYSQTLIANFKTAMMLFIVTLVMILVYTPALLTSLGIIRYNPIHWNIIYINNAANPIVYSFMNKNFRKIFRKIRFFRN